MALANELLKNNFTVVGIGKKNSISHPDFSFLELDLLNQNDVAKFRFPENSYIEVLLINNTGILGDILPVGELTADHFQRVMQVNTVSQQILINEFIHAYLAVKNKVHVINISSGAGKRPIDAWSAYCASKAALDLFSETVNAEMKQRGVEKFHIHSIAPGVVDTKMQTQIRAASPEKFLASDRFHKIKSNGELISPVYVAKKILQLINDPSAVGNCHISLSDI
ncbi:MAG: SDR family NAD(P)-dependent oxidoreductase [Crocinitomicaceae bacterium]|nr:SDR family NAD(P)-dependent oxidoreductase [Crocinitomicaceae bacterium]